MADAFSRHLQINVNRIDSSYNENIMLDVIVCKPIQSPVAVLYLTGSKYFNIAMRKVAKEKGYLLSNSFVNKIHRSGKQEQQIVESERDVFELLGLQYVEPRFRINLWFNAVLEKIRERNEERIRI